MGLRAVSFDQSTIFHEHTGLTVRRAAFEQETLSRKFLIPL